MQSNNGLKEKATKAAVPTSTAASATAASAAAAAIVDIVEEVTPKVSPKTTPKSKVTPKARRASMIAITPSQLARVVRAEVERSATKIFQEFGLQQTTVASSDAVPNMVPIRRQQARKAQVAPSKLTTQPVTVAPKKPAVAPKVQKAIVSKKKAAVVDAKPAVNRSLGFSDETYPDGEDIFGGAEFDPEEFEDYEEEEDDDDDVIDDATTTTTTTTVAKPSWNRTKEGDFINKEDMFTEANVFDAGKWYLFLSNMSHVEALRAFLIQVFHEAQIKRMGKHSMTEQLREDAACATKEILNLAVTFVTLEGVREAPCFLNVVHSTLKRTYKVLTLVRSERTDAIKEAYKSRPEWIHTSQNSATSAFAALLKKAGIDLDALRQYQGRSAGAKRDRKGNGRSFAKKKRFRKSK